MKNIYFIALSIFVTSSSVFAQGFFGLPISQQNNSSPSNRSSAQQKSTPSSLATTSGDYSSSTIEGQSDKIFDPTTDNVDPLEGTINWKGKHFNIGDSRIVRARFERYLGAPLPNGDKDAYLAILKEIDTRLSPESLRKIKTQEAWQKEIHAIWLLLYKAADFEQDAMQSVNIASQVYKVWRVKSEHKEVNRWRNDLEREQKDIRYKIMNRERAQTIQMSNSISSKVMKGVQSKTNAVPKTSEQLYLIQDEKLKEAEIKKTESHSSLIEVQSKLEFQGLIVKMLAMRRFQHAAIAASFYRVLFKGAFQTLEIGKETMKDLLPVDNYIPTIDSVDSIAREISKDVDIGLSAVDSHWDNGEKYTAFSRLQETFLFGEYEPNLTYYPVEKKRQFIELWRLQRELTRLSDTRDLENIEGQVAKLKEIANDFPANEVMSKVNAAKRASELEVLAARSAISLVGADGTPPTSEKIEKAMAEAQEHLKLATNYWPHNPNVTNFMKEILSKADIKTQLTPNFDNAYENHRWREIYDKKAEYMYSFVQDPERSEKLEKVVKEVATIDQYLAQVDALAARKDYPLAWDILLSAEKVSTEDSVLLAMKARLAPLVANYAQAIGNAVDSETNGNNGSALAYYLIAQDLNPASDICRNGIGRVSSMLLENKESKKEVEPITKPVAEPVEKDNSVKIEE